MWDAKTAIDEGIWTEEYSKQIISSSIRHPLPDPVQSIGDTSVVWQEPIPGYYHVHASGGSVDDRYLARTIVSEELEVYGLKRLSFTMGGPTLRKEASWDDVQQKAIRLINSGNVQILRNAPEVVVGHVIGDHGEYQTELSRQDPDSNVLTNWQCECVLPGGMVFMFDGSTKSVENIATGDEVLTATARKGIVGRTFKREYNGMAVGLSAAGSEDIAWLTSDHKLLTPEIDVVEAKDWTEGHIAFMPTAQGDALRQLKVHDQIEYWGWVYNFEVLDGEAGYDEHTYVLSPGIASANCPWDQFAWQRTRSWKSLEGRPCWVENSEVTMANGTHKFIQHIKVGDSVLSTDGVSKVEAIWENKYNGGMRTFRRVGSNLTTTITDDHKMIINNKARTAVENILASSTKTYKVRNILLDDDSWEKCLAKNACVGDWVQLTYPTEIQNFSIDVESLSPYFHRDGDVVYKSVYPKGHPKMVRHLEHQKTRPHKISQKSINKLSGRIAVGDDHWIYNGFLDKDKNQLRFYANSKNHNVRKIIWELNNGPRPEGSIIKMTCDEVRCVNPSHMSVRNKKRLGKRAVQTLAAKLSPSTDLLTIVGYFLAEGSFENNDCDVAWTFNYSETEYIERLEKALLKLNAGNLRRYPDKKNNRISVKVANSLLVEVLRYLCGSGSRTKMLAPELMLMNPLLQHFFLDRYAEGDAHIPIKGPIIFSTSSDKLAHQLVTIGSRVFSAIPTTSRIKNSGGPTNRDKELYINQVRMNQAYNQGIERIRPGIYAAKITTIEEFDHDGVVYNLTVPPTHTVAVDDILSFQCAHVLATHWYAQGTPLDQEFDPTTGQPMPQEGPGGQQGLPMALPPATGPTGPPAPAMPAGGPQDPSGGAPDPSGQLSIPGIDPNGGTPPPAPPGVGVIPPMPVAPVPPPVSVPGAKVPSPENPMQWPGSTFSAYQEDEWRFSAAGDTFENSDMVRINKEEYGTATGGAEGRGHGEWRVIKKNSIGEVLDQDSTTGWTFVSFPIHDSGALEPHIIQAWIDSKDLSHANVAKPGPFLKRKR